MISRFATTTGRRYAHTTAILETGNIRVVGSYKRITDAVQASHTLNRLPQRDRDLIEKAILHNDEQAIRTLADRDHPPGTLLKIYA
jgi:hypothetical protein